MPRQDDQGWCEAARPDNNGASDPSAAALSPVESVHQLDAGTGAAFDAAWVAVLAGHSGAGASTIALALLDALAVEGRPARLIETTPGERSSLVAAAAAELGVDSSGMWLRGLRGQSLVLRQAPGTSPQGWPATTEPTTTIVDIGQPSPESIARLSTADPRIVLVTRATVPGLRLTEQRLTQLSTATQVSVVAVGRPRWPGAVTASLGPRLRALRESGAVVTVPMDRRLEVAGLTSGPLPASLGKAATLLLAQLGPATPTRQPRRANLAGRLATLPIRSQP